jgi:molybdopterin converting factor subunit 1
LRIRVLLFAAHRESFGRSEVSLEVPPGTTLEGVYAVMAAREARLSDLRPYTSFALNREVVDPRTRVQDGDEVAFLQPVSGG